MFNMQKLTRRDALRSLASVASLCGLSHGRILLGQERDEPDGSPVWIGQGAYRLLVQVDPVDLQGRTFDELPTRIHLSSADVQRQIGVKGKIDAASIEVARYDPATGDAFPYGKWAYAHGLWEVPSRWYDDSIPEYFPEVVGDINGETGQLDFTPQRNWGYFYETLGEWDGGHIAWMHTQQGQKPSYYAIYFNLLPDGEKPSELPRRGYLGDGSERTKPDVPRTHGLLLCRIDVADWNGDGLPDILVGGERGGIVWYPNQGTREEPSYPFSKLLLTADGKPLDVGFSATPLVIDWDGDGVQDLVCGCEWNRAVWYKNIGTNADPRLVYKGLIHTDDGKPFQLPHEPVIPAFHGIYKTDYHPVLAAGDLNGDGQTEILAGGYVTGRIYLYTIAARNADHAPILHFVGPLEADGEPLCVGWAAAPTVGDVDGDGLLDIISGDMPETAEGADSASSENFLYYFKNIGTRTEPKFTKRPFPVQGTFPVSSLAAPRLADLTGNGLLDLVVGRDTDLSIYYNVGTKHEPRWKYAPAMPGKWHTAPLCGWGAQFIDWNGDGLPDLVEDLTVRLNLGKGNPQLFGPAQSILGPGEKIFHKSPYGDQWTYTYVVDFDGDGRLDILYGVHEGWVYFHRNLSDGSGTRFDTKGVRLMMENGKPIQVGAPPGTPWSFDILQGARTTVAAADFDQDGKVDLIVGDTYGKVRYYRNLTGGTHPVFSEPELIAEVGSRLVPTVADWNGDGWPDLIIGNQYAWLLQNTGKRRGPRFRPIQPLNLAPPPAGNGPPDRGLLPYEVVVNGVDWDGDGDIDLLAICTYGYLCWFDRSFLQHGYAPARALGLGKK